MPQSPSAMDKLTLNINGKDCLHPFFPLLQQGFQLIVPMPITIGQLLSTCCAAPLETLLKRIQTIFLNGKPVDAPTAAIVNSGDCVALSAAMPGLVGATLRSGGLLAGFRQGISHQADQGPSSAVQEGLLCIKLFNLLIKEIGPDFLAKGVLIPVRDVSGLLDDLQRTCGQPSITAEWNDMPLALRQWPPKDIPESSPPTLLTVFFQ